MKKQRELFDDRRICCACVASADSKRRREGDDSIITIYPAVYRKGTGKGGQRRARPVHICEPCFVRALSGRGLMVGPREVRRTWEALRESFAACYNNLLDEDRA